MYSSTTVQHLVSSSLYLDGLSYDLLGLEGIRLGVLLEKRSDCDV